MSLHLLIAAAISLSRSEPDGQISGEIPTEAAGAHYSAANLTADCVSAIGGDPVGRRMCRDAIREQLDLLFPSGQDNTANGCLVIPTLTDRAIIDAAMSAIAQAQASSASSASELAAVTLLTLYPCGVRRR